MTKVKSMTKYISCHFLGIEKGFDDAKYIYFDGQKWIVILLDGEKKELPKSAYHIEECIKNSYYVEAGPVDHDAYQTDSRIKPNKTYLMIEPNYIWFAKGDKIINFQWYIGYILKTKEELDNECFVGQGKFIVELP